MELFCGLFVRVGLDTESLVDGEDFEQEWEVAVLCLEAIDDGFTDEVRVGCEVFRERLYWVGNGQGRRRRVCAHP